MFNTTVGGRGIEAPDLREPPRNDELVMLPELDARRTDPTVQVGSQGVIGRLPARREDALRSRASIACALQGSELSGRSRCREACRGA